MHDIAIKYYKMGLYNDEQLAKFVKLKYVSKEEYKELTGKDYIED